MQDCEDHAVLLCNLLLGFGLDAYVCVGTKTKGSAHAWVMTVSPDDSITFWESLTGERYSFILFSVVSGNLEMFSIYEKPGRVFSFS